MTRLERATQVVLAALFLWCCYQQGVIWRLQFEIRMLHAIEEYYLP